MATYSEFLDSKPLPKRGWRRIIGATCRGSPSCS